MRNVKYLAFVALFFALTIGKYSYAANFTTSTNLNNYTADDVGNLTLTGRDAYDTQGANTPALTINGSSSGNTVLKSSSTASGTLTLPATTDTLAVNGNLAPSGTISPQGVPFSTATLGNPLLLSTVQNITLASVNTSGGYTFLKGATGRTIWPNDLTVMASGTAAGATAVFIQCTSGTLLASFPVAALVTNKPVSPFGSTEAGSGPVAGVAWAQGCPANDGILVSVQGSALTTTNNFYINMPYTIQ